MFPPLLAELCARIAVVPQKIGRPPLSLRDAAFTAALKVYSTLSARRFATELRAAHKAGFVSRVAGQATIHNILGDDSLTPILRSLVERSALPFAAIEETFVNRDPQSALKLGQARGVALASLALTGLPVAEYAANLIKKTVVGVGHAEKRQVAMMVRMLLPASTAASPDAADALAVAICHAQHRVARARGAA